MDEGVFRIIDVDHQLLQSERERILGLISSIVPFASVMEAGSTALDDLIGKQDIDFVVRAPPDQFRETRAVLDRHFERNDRQLSNEEFQGYRVRSPLDAAIQLTIAGGPYDDFEKFLNRLKADATLRRAYNGLKRTFDGRPMDEYRRAKQAFIKAVLAAQDSGE